MSFMYKYGRFHFLFADREDEFYTQGLLRLDWTNMVCLMLRKAGYRRILFVHSDGQEKVTVRSVCERDFRMASDTGKGQEKGLFGLLFKGGEGWLRQQLARMDAGTTVSLARGEFQELILFILRGEREGETAFAVPVELFAGLYREPEQTDRLIQTIHMKQGQTFLPSKSGGSIFLLTASMAAEESLNPLLDEQGVFHSSLFPEMREYVYGKPRTESFYMRMRRAFTAERFAGIDALSETGLYRMLLRQYYLGHSDRISLSLLKEEAGCLYMLMHCPAWRREAESMAEAAGDRLRLPAPGESGAMRALRLQTENSEFLGMVARLVRAFHEKYGENAVFSEIFASRVRSGELPTLQNPVPEFELVKEKVSAIAGFGKSRQGVKNAGRLDKIEMSIAAPWEGAAPQPSFRSGETGFRIGGSLGSMPQNVRRELTKCADWLTQYQGFGADNIDSVFRYMELVIARGRGSAEESTGSGDKNRMDNEFSLLISAEFAAADSRQRLIRLQEIERDEIRRIDWIGDQLQNANPEGTFLAEQLGSKMFLTEAEEQFLKLRRSFAEAQEHLKQVQAMEKKVMAEQQQKNQVCRRLKLMIETAGSHNYDTQMEEVKDLVEKLRKQTDTDRIGEENLRKEIELRG